MKAPRPGLWLRQFVYLLLVAVGVTAVLVLVVTRGVRQSSIRQLEAGLKREAVLVGEAIPGSGADSSGLQAMIQRLGTAAGLRITVIDSSGRVLADSRADPARMENHRYRPEVIAALEDSVGTAFHASRTLPEEMLYVAVRRKTGERVYVVRTSIDTREVRAVLAGINRQALLASAGLLVLVLGISLVFAQSFTRPLRRLTRTAERIASGEMVVTGDDRRGDEIGRLANAMNAMSGQIRKLLSRLAFEKGQLQAIIGSMTEGVTMLDRDRRIVMANASFRRIFGLTPDRLPELEPGDSTPPAPRPYIWEALRNKDFQDQVDQVFSTRTTTTRELRVGDRVFSATAVPLEDPAESVVVVLHDITELKDLERVKAELIANVSHELRTPLTAIKGFAETLGSEASGNARHFLSIIERNANRLINLVNDLLTISRLEREGQRLELEPIELAEVAHDAYRTLERAADEKGLKMSIETAPGTPSVRADRYLIEQMFVNLLDNAIKNTAQGEVRIRISRVDERSVGIEVSDTGIGIPAEHLPRIFERFYVVDKNRSRELGGTGLGLAIVKHIVLAHNGSIEVESKPGRGTTFRILLPVK